MYYAITGSCEDLLSHTLLLFRNSLKTLLGSESRVDSEWINKSNLKAPRSFWAQNFRYHFVCILANPVLDKGRRTAVRNKTIIQHDYHHNKKLLCFSQQTEQIQI